MLSYNILWLTYVWNFCRTLPQNLTYCSYWAELWKTKIIPCILFATLGMIVFYGTHEHLQISIYLWFNIFNAKILSFTGRNCTTVASVFPPSLQLGPMALSFITNPAIWLTGESPPPKCIYSTREDNICKLEFLSRHQLCASESYKPVL